MLTVRVVSAHRNEPIKSALNSKLKDHLFISRPKIFSCPLPCIAFLLVAYLDYSLPSISDDTKMKVPKAKCIVRACCRMILLLSNCTDLILRTNLYIYCVHPLPTFICFTGMKSIPSSVYFLSILFSWRFAESWSICRHCVRGRVHPGQVASPSPGHIKRNDADEHLHSHLDL